MKDKLVNKTGNKKNVQLGKELNTDEIKQVSGGQSELGSLLPYGKGSGEKVDPYEQHTW